MRLATLARRTIAVTAATALLSTGGLVPGFLGSAQAVGPVPMQIPDSATPAASANSGNPKILVRGTNFNPATASVFLAPRFTGVNVGNVPAYVDLTVATNSTTQLTVVLGAASEDDFQLGSTLDFYAPGPYDIAVGNDAEGFGTCGRTCFTLTQPSVPTATTSAKDTPNGHNGDGALVITGKNISTGATVTAVTPDGLVDDKITFTPSAGTSTSAIYANGTTLRADYTKAAGFTPGRHVLRLTNTDTQFGIGTAEFWQPSITSISPTRLGRGATATVTVSGEGFRVGARLGVQAVTPVGGVADITVGTSTVSGDGKVISATVTVGTNADLTARAVSVRSTDGAFDTLANGLTIAARPSVTCLTTRNATVCPTTATTFNIGQGATGIEAKIFGAGFVVGPPATTFGFGGAGLTAQVVDGSVAGDGTSARVLLTATKDATTGGRSVTASNPDFGNGSLGPNNAGTFPVAVTPAPLTSSVLPASSSRAVTQNVTVNGSGFVQGMTAVFAAPDGSTNNVTVNGTPTVTDGTSGAPDTLRLSVSVQGAAAAGPYNLVLTNPDAGTSTCVGCYKIDSLTVDSATLAGTNTDTARRVKFLGSGLPATGTAKLVRSTVLADQPEIVAASYTGAGDGLSGEAFFDLTSVAPGAYDAVVTSGTTLLFCTACFTVTGSTPTVTKIVPAVGGQGATGIPVTLTGTKFSRGMTVSIAGLSITGVTFVDVTTLTATVAIPVGATTGAADVVARNADAGLSGTLPGGFTVNAGPKPATIAPVAKGQGATEQTATVTGPGFVTGSAVNLGQGVTILSAVVTDNTGTTAAPNPDDKIVVTFTVSPDAPIGPRDVVVTNPDSGRGLIANAFTVNVGPKPVSISPLQLKQGETADVVIVGTGFAADATPKIDGVTFAETALDEDGNLTATATVDAAAPLGALNVVVTNPADGGTGTCSGCFSVVSVPSVPQSVTVTVGTRSATVAWAAPATDGGTPVNGYSVDNGVDGPRTLGASTFATTFTGLTPLQTYTFSVVANNAVGGGPAAKVTGTPYDVPLAPTAVTAVAGDGTVTVSWSGANDQGSTISAYTVKASNGAGTIEKEVPGSQSSFQFTGLSNGTALTFTVKAANAAGYGSYSTASATATPNGASKLTSVRSPLSSVAGSAVTYSGRLTRADGTPIPGVAVVVKLTPDIGNSRNVSLTTNSNGAWSFRFAPVYNTTVRAGFAGSPSATAAQAAVYKMSVATRIVRSSPASGTTTRSTTTLPIKGYTTPNKAGRTIGLYNGTRLIARAVIASNGTYTINTRLARGTYTLRVALGATSGNVPGTSPNFIVRRS